MLTWKLKRLWKIFVQIELFFSAFYMVPSRLRAVDCRLDIWWLSNDTTAIQIAIELA